MTFTDDEARVIERMLNHAVSLTAVQSALSAAGFEIVRGWRPIAEAPGKGFRALVWSNIIGVEIGWHFSDGTWSQSEYYDGAPTHFRPLPDPPKESADAS